jgi:hypothetical protein
MKLRIFNILTLTLLIFVSACSNSRLSDEEIENKAIAITEKLNKENIDIFRKWNFGLRGQAEIWTKTVEDSTLYSCMYFQSTDTVSIVAFNNFIYSQDFPLKIELDTSKYWRFEFKKSLDHKIEIVGIDHNGKDIVIKSNQTESEIFENKSPFVKMDSLSTLKDELGVYGISHIGRIGDFIQFYITGQDVLTFISDYSTFDPRYKDVWIKEFSKGKEIKEKWNLRRLDKPIDNG